MSIEGVKIACDTLNRNGKISLQIAYIKDDIYLKFGNSDRDIFIVKKSNLLEAFKILGIS
jgi:hypothetical protein